MEVVATEASLSFYSTEAIEKAGVRVWRNKDEWGPYVRPHIHLVRNVTNSLSG